MRTGRASLGFVLVGLLGGCGDDGAGGTTDATGTPGTTTMMPSTMSGSTSGSSTGGAPTSSTDPTTGTPAGTSTGGPDETTTPTMSTGQVDPSTTSGDGTTSGSTGGESSGGESSSGASSSGGEESTGEPVVCDPPKPDSGQCEACLEMNCCTEYDACFMDAKCTCVFDCIFMTNGPMGCAFQCMNVGMQNPTLGDMFICGQECPGCPW